MRTAIRDMTRRARTLLVEEMRRRLDGPELGEGQGKEVALKHLVRLATFKMLEARGLVTRTIDRYLIPGDGGGLTVLLGPDDLAGGPCPRHRVLRELIDMLDDPALLEAWGPGNEETIGWIYQYFNEPDLEVFHSQSPPKVPAELVPAKTQLFTPRWIVRFLVENTLGRLWVEMHPDSCLVDRLDYLVPRVGERLAAPFKSARAIRVLDPACGTMHFGLVVFDLLVEMYKEELGRAGEPGWPESASVSCEGEIPAAILAHNLFGFDIDPLAVDLSRLTLGLRAKTMAPEAVVDTSNLHCVDVLLGGGVRPATGGGAGPPGTLAALERVYDVVVTNPPYLDSRDYNPQLKSFMASAYPASKRNLYSAFLERCVGFLGDSGCLGMITPQTFMFISSFAKLRSLLRERVAIETLVHTGLNTFPDAVVDAAFYVLRRVSGADRRDRSVGTYFRLVREPDVEAKRVGFEKALCSLRRSVQSGAVYRCRQGDFDAIPGRPWVYWITPGLRRLFEALPTFSEIAQPIVGLQTSDNSRFLRYWWEVFVRGPGPEDAGLERNGCIGFGCMNRAEARLSGKKWFPHLKGGSFRRWYGNQEHVVNWADDGAEIRNLGIESGRVASRPQNMDFYFRPGVTWTHTSSRGLSVRVLPAGFICNVEGMAAFQKGSAGSSQETLAILNSAFARHMIDLLNPTVHFGGREVGDLPYPAADSAAVKTLEALVEQAIALARADSVEDETTYEFVAPPAWEAGRGDVARRHGQLAEIEQRIDDEVYRLYGLDEDDRAAIEADLSASSSARQRAEDTRAGGESLSRENLARRWVSYAVGIVMGRFHPGIEGALGCGRFPAQVAESLRAMSFQDGIAPLDPDHEADLALKVGRVLELMLGPAGAGEVIRTAAGDGEEPATPLRRYLAGRFFSEHVRQYRKRPIYWLLQSPRRLCSVYIYYERITRDTLPIIRSSRYVDAKIASAQVVRADLQAFDDALRRVLEGRDERGRTVGWAPAIDDGVMLNLAPLHKLVPAWRTELVKYWNRLEAGDCDWSCTARRYWPDRVLAKCRTNKSLALAHDRLDLYEL